MTRRHGAVYRVKARDLDDNAISNSTTATTAQTLLSDQALRRFCLRNDLQQVSGKSTFDQLRAFCHCFMHEMVEKMTVYADHEYRFVLILKDVINAAKLLGVALYGIEFVNEELPPNNQQLHATELLEYPSIFRPLDHELECDLEQEPECEEPGFGNSHRHGWRRQQQQLQQLQPQNRRVSHFRHTDFVANLTQRLDEDDTFLDEMVDSDLDEEWDFDEEDSDSDSDSDSSDFDWEDDCSQQDEEEAHEQMLQQIQQQFPKKTQEERKDCIKKRFIKALDNAQQVVDQELLSIHDVHHQSQDAIMEDDAAIGQGYYSDYGANLSPRLIPEWKQTVQNEEKCWKQEGHFWFSDPDLTAEILQQQASSSLFDMDRNPYLLPRELIFQLLHCYMNQNGMWRITSAALSALHNMFEQHLHFHLQQGKLRHEILAQIEQETSATLYQENTELREEVAFQRQQVTQQTKEMHDMTQAFKAKELEMQRKIQKLEYLLQEFQHHEQQRFGLDSASTRRHQMEPTEALAHTGPTAPTHKFGIAKENLPPSYHQQFPLLYQPRRVSPGKRKALAGTDDPAVLQDHLSKSSQLLLSSSSSSSSTTSTGAPTSTNSFANKFLSGLQSLRSKKARINPTT